VLWGSARQHTRCEAAQQQQQQQQQAAAAAATASKSSKSSSAAAAFFMKPNLSIKNKHKKNKKEEGLRSFKKHTPSSRTITRIKSLLPPLSLLLLLQPGPPPHIPKSAYYTVLLPTPVYPPHSGFQQRRTKTQHARLTVSA
jgi:hypothetical protein